MGNGSTFSILFWVYTKRVTNNQGDIYARVTVDGKRSNISLKRKVDVSKWDSKQQKLKGTSREAREINQFLSGIHAQLFQYYQDLKLNGELISAKLIKAHFCGETVAHRTLQNLIDYHRDKISNTLSAGTIRNFQVTEKYIKRYLSEVFKSQDIFLRQLNYKFITDFEHFLRQYWPKGHPNCMSHNTIMKHIQRLRKIVTLGYHIEWIDKDPFIRWKPKWEKREREFLSLEELKGLEDHEFISDRLDRVRDLFVFSCYTGISYVDIVQLTVANLYKGIDGEDWIVTKRQKTSVPVKIPLLKKAKELMAKYKGHPITQVSGTLFPVITNEKLNQYLKEVAEYCEISKNLTFHMARHTFATTVTLSNGVPIETVSKLLGHTKISTTQIYARVVENKISQDMGILKDCIVSLSV